MSRSTRPRRSPIVTLASDLGAAYAAQMKAVLVRFVDPGRIVDLAHDLPAHAVRESAFVLRAMASGFPHGSIHVAVVDPGVGGRRAGVIVCCRDGSRLVGPDNGLLAPLGEALGVARTIRIDGDRLGLGRRTGTTFDGRDVFAPAAGILAAGGDPAALGQPTTLRPLHLPSPTRTPRGGRGEVVHVDRFGNLVTNLPTSWVPGHLDVVELSVGDLRRRLPWVRSYEELGLRRLGALGSSFGTIEIAVAEGRAADRLRAGSGTRVTLTAVGRKGAVH